MKFIKSNKMINANVKNGLTNEINSTSKRVGLFDSKIVIFQTYSFIASMMKNRITPRSKLPK